MLTKEIDDAEYQLMIKRLKEAGFGVVEGAEAVRKKIKEIGNAK